MLYNHIGSDDMFAERLKKLRTDKGLSQEELAKVVGVKQQTIGGWENGRTEPDHQITCKLADFFGTTTDDLLGRSNSVAQKAKPTKEEIMKIFESLPLEEQKAFLKKYINSVLS